MHQEFALYLLGKKFWAFAGGAGGLVLVDELGAGTVQATYKAFLLLKCTDHQFIKLPTKNLFD